MATNGGNYLTRTNNVTLIHCTLNLREEFYGNLITSILTHIKLRKISSNDSKTGKTKPGRFLVIFQ